ncbi:MAG: Ig domain-containing protein [Firmicutes bacterium]|nr:Ig domain-containing protein [Bacillota bacterium]
MKTTKRILSILLTLAMALGLATLASAGSVTDSYVLTLVGSDPLLGASWLDWLNTQDGKFFQGNPDMLGGLLGGLLGGISIGSWNVGSAITSAATTPGAVPSVATSGGEKTYTVKINPNFSFSTSANIALSVPPNTVFELNGPGSFTSTYSGAAATTGIISNGLLTVKGNNTLSFKGGNVAASRVETNGLKAFNLTIQESAKVNATGGAAATGVSTGVRAMKANLNLAIEDDTLFGTITVNGSDNDSAPTVLNATGDATALNSYGILGKLTITGIAGATVVASGENGALNPAYTVPRGYEYYVSKTTTANSTKLISDGTAVIDPSYQWAKIVAKPCVAAALATAALPDGGVGVPYGPVVLEAKPGCTPPFTWTVEDLPNGLTFNPATCEISGKPTQDGNFNVKITVDNRPDPAGSTGTNLETKILPLYINPAPEAPLVTTTALPDGFLETLYEQTIEATCADAYTWTFVSGNLPNGLTFNAANGVISGTPAKKGTYTFTVRAYNSASGEEDGFKELTIVIGPKPVPPGIQNESLLGGTMGVAYNQGLTLLSTGSAPITWTIDSGVLPDGLALDAASGVISGTPTKTGKFDFTVKAANSAGTYTKALSITIVSPPPVKPTKWVGLFGYNTRYVSNFWNWFKFIVLFGWIWMWFI